jgi:hypothetical protein
MSRDKGEVEYFQKVSLQKIITSTSLTKKIIMVINLLKLVKTTNPRKLIGGIAESVSWLNDGLGNRRIGVRIRERERDSFII